MTEEFGEQNEEAGPPKIPNPGFRLPGRNAPQEDSGYVAWWASWVSRLFKIDSSFSLK